MGSNPTTPTNHPRGFGAGLGGLARLVAWIAGVRMCGRTGMPGKGTPGACQRERWERRDRAAREGRLAQPGASTSLFESNDRKRPSSHRHARRRSSGAPARCVLRCLSECRARPRTRGFGRRLHGRVRRRVRTVAPAGAGPRRERVLTLQGRRLRGTRSTGRRSGAPASFRRTGWRGPDRRASPSPFEPRGSPRTSPRSLRLRPIRPSKRTRERLALGVRGGRCVPCDPRSLFS